MNRQMRGRVKHSYGTTLSLSNRPNRAPTVLHELGHDEDGFLGDHCKQAHQPRVLQGLHHVGLGQEVLHGHGADLEVLDGHLPVVVVDA